jgi:hypothetical protein
MEFRGAGFTVDASASSEKDLNSDSYLGTIFLPFPMTFQKTTPDQITDSIKLVHWKGSWKTKTILASFTILPP